MTPAQAGRRRRWLPWLGAFIGTVALVWVLRGFDIDRFAATLADAEWRYLPMLVLAIAAEQLVRAWKWRQLLQPLRAIGTVRLFGAIMAGYLIAFLLPFGMGTVARCAASRRRSPKASRGRARAGAASASCWRAH